MKILNNPMAIIIILLILLYMVATIGYQLASSSNVASKLDSTNKRVSRIEKILEQTELLIIKTNDKD